MTLKNQIFKSMCAFSAVSVLLIVLGMLITLVVESFPALRHFGFLNFLTTADWNYSKEIFGALRPLTGTVISSIIALIAAVPVAVGTAIFLTELCPDKLRRPIGTAVELLAAIPSIIYGMWGLLVFAPFMEKYVEPVVSASLGNLPIIGNFFQANTQGGVGLLTASLVLAIMIIPFIASISRDAFNQVPDMLKESAYGLGATRWETLYQVVIPYSRNAMAGGIIIAMGRALGETMAVAYVIGNRHAPLDSIFSPYSTITSVMANEFNEAANLQMSSLFALALILFLANFLAIIAANRFLPAKK
ncbi:MAG: phosphate ABC transporter permease subunit PstC [Deltaproteobacteria bacterium]|nr:phosphate ABC transporter permease subunit PstC [Deltaproteobacteria bacterium]